VTSFQNFSGSTSSDPRIGHVLAGDGAANGVSAITFADGDDNPFWSYTVTVPANSTRRIANFATLSGLKSVAATNSAAISSGSMSDLWTGLTLQEKLEIVNFAAVLPPSAPGTPSATVDLNTGATTVTWTAPVDIGGAPITGYTVTTSTAQTCATTGATTCAFSNLPLGEAVTFTVVASNAGGNSPASASSQSVTPATTTTTTTAPVSSGLPYTGQNDRSLAAMGIGLVVVGGGAALVGEATRRRKLRFRRQR
jgi:hypothetical protein